MFCKHCGKELRDQTIFCPVCENATENYLMLEEKRFNWAAVLGFSFAMLLIFLIFFSVNFALGIIAMLLLSVDSFCGFVFSIVGWIQAVKLQKGKLGFAIAGTVISSIWFWVIFMMLIGLLV